jgi:predicted ATPase
MKLTFVSRHKSIESFESIELPALTVVTGINGAGKSHLLEALFNGCIGISEPPISANTNEIRKFDWNDLQPRNSGNVIPSQIGQERHQWWTILSSSIEQSFNQVTTEIKKYYDQDNTDYSSLIEKIYDLQYLDDQIPIELRSHRNFLRDFITRVEQSMEQQFYNAGGRTDLLGRAKEVFNMSGVPILLMKEEDFLETCPISAPQVVDIFQNSFAQLFSQYRKIQAENQWLEYLNTWKGKGRSFLSEEQFIEKYGSPPWEFVNAILESAGLNFKIESPSEEYLDKPFSAQLIHNSNGQKIQFSDISSGEKILMSFAHCLYYAKNKDQVVQYPKLLLFDEIDAPLHPSMSRTLLKTIQEVLVNQYGINVIMTTHSPATVALAPEESLFIACKDSPERLRKANNRDEALTALLEGVPSLRIDYKNNRQVFVESRYDASTYTKLYQQLKRKLQKEIPLYFVSSGDSQDNTGNSDRVKYWTKQLRDCGNESVCGIIDWDLKNEGNSTVKILGKNNRYSRENYIFDPLLLIPLFLLERIIEPSEVLLPADANFLNFRSHKDEFQAAVDAFVQIVYDRWTNQPSASSITQKHDEIDVMMTNHNAISCYYLNGLTINIPEWYIRIKGHYLFEISQSDGLLPTAFPQLKKYRKAEKLEEEILSKVIEQMPELISVDFIDLFNSLQEI